MTDSAANYAKTSERSPTWHHLRPDEDELDNTPSYCGLGMTKPQKWVVTVETVDEIPKGDLLCLRCKGAGRFLPGVDK